MLQCFDASQPTASQLLPPPMSPEASLPAQQHHQPSSSPQQSHSSSHAAAEPGTLDTRNQQSLQGVGTGGSSIQDRLQAGSGPGSMEGLHGLCGRSSDLDQAILLAEVGPAETARHRAGQAGGEQAILGAVSTAERDSSAGAACEADVEVLADSPEVPSGQVDSQTPSSDLQLKISQGAAPQICTAPPAEVMSGRAEPARTGEATVPFAEVSLRSAQWASLQEPSAVRPRQSPLASEATPAYSDSDGELEEPLWEPEPAPKAPPRCAACP